MKPPVFVVNTDGSGVGMHGDIQRAEGHLEAIDGLNGEYEVFDSDSRRLQATAASDDSPVAIVEATNGTPQPEELRRILREDLRALRRGSLPGADAPTTTLPPVPARNASVAPAHARQWGAAPGRDTHGG